HKNTLRPTRMLQGLSTRSVDKVSWRGPSTRASNKDQQQGPSTRSINTIGTIGTIDKDVDQTYSYME
ncbi:hypothetical protein BGX34_006256, partial [Mortierella sp. NVP85]